MKDPNEARRLAALEQYDIAGTPPEPNFDRITLVAGKVFGTTFSTLNLVEADRLWIKSRSGIDVEQLPRRLSFCDHAIRGDEVMVVPDATVDRRFAESCIVAGPPYIRFYAGAPLITPQGQRIGTLCLLDPRADRQFTADDALVLSQLAATTMELIEARARAIELTALSRQVSHQARHDPLTGLANRRGLLARCDELMARCGPDDQLALLYLDLDGFKSVNDERGHLAGDQLLVQVGWRLREALRHHAIRERPFEREDRRAGDSLARIGGDEFVVLLHGDGDLGRHARDLADHLVRRLRQPFEIGGRRLTIGASIGVAVEAATTASLESLLHRADALLYDAKAGGKGRYLFSDDDLVSLPSPPGYLTAFAASLPRR